MPFPIALRSYKALLNGADIEFILIEYARRMPNDV